VKEIKDLDKDRDEDELIANTEYFLKQRKTDLLLEKAVDEKINDKEVNLDEFQKESEKISNICLLDDLGLDYFGDNERVVSYLTQENSFISTGYKGIDDCLGGGMFKEGRVLYTFCGETNVGKSIMVGNIATNVILQDYNVLIITLEMSEDRYGKRISSMLTKIALDNLKDKIEDYKSYISSFVQEKQARLHIKEFPGKSVSARQVAAYIKKLQKRKNFKPDLIVIDYCSLMKPSISQSTVHAAIQYVVQETRAISYQFKCPILSPMQLNRTSHKSSSPALDALAGSWDAASDMDNIINLAQSDEDRELNVIRYINVKSRDGKKGITGQLNIDYNTLRFFEEGMVEKKSEAVRQMENLTEHLDFSELFVEDE
jgi:replicative DNA helicase